jgi:hypothetical protein
MWATADESSAYLIDLYKRVWEHSDTTIDELDLGAPGVVPLWSEKSKNTTLGRILVHMIVETQRHLGMPTEKTTAATQKDQVDS